MLFYNKDIVQEILKYVDFIDLFKFMTINHYLLDTITTNNILWKKLNEKYYNKINKNQIKEYCEKEKYIILKKLELLLKYQFNNNVFEITILLLHNTQLTKLPKEIYYLDCIIKI